MTSPTLIFGAILLAFSPTIFLLLHIIFPKPQLVILAVCAAFAYLLSALCSSLIWLITSAIFGSDHGGGGGGSGGVGFWVNACTGELPSESSSEYIPRIEAQE